MKFIWMKMQKIRSFIPAVNKGKVTEYKLKGTV